MGYPRLLGLGLWCCAIKKSRADSNDIMIILHGAMFGFYVQRLVCNKCMKSRQPSGSHRSITVSSIGEILCRVKCEKKDLSTFVMNHVYHYKRDCALCSSQLVTQQCLFNRTLPTGSTDEDALNSRHKEQSKSHAGPQPHHTPV